MAILISAYQIRKAFAARPLFDSISFTINSGDRVGVIGPNGAGKSTLFKILANQMEPDEGSITRTKGLRIGVLDQVPVFDPKKTVYETVTENIADRDAWESVGRAHEICSRLGLDLLTEGLESKMGKLSGGWQKKAVLARELAMEPDLLLLDEPTNHLDLDSILWLEEYLERQPFAVLTVTHDRYFLDRVSTRILELDRRNEFGLLSIEGNYSDYLETKERLLKDQSVKETVLKNILRRETEWVRRGAKARTTKQEARIKRHGELAAEVSEVATRNQTREVRLDFQNTERAPKKLLEAKQISQILGGQSLFSGLDVILRPGFRLGLLGPNGCGKSTLIRTLLGDLKPTSGEVIRSEALQVAYFEQNRDSLDPELSLQKTICPSGEFVDFRGARIHIRSFLDRFLFSAEQATMPIGKLSGGEQSRVLLAKLMLEPANVLVLDEPTNDLDLQTLGVLEECLIEFNGAVLLVTHDRYFLDRVSTQILAFDVTASDPKKRIIPFADLFQWEEWRDERDDLIKSREKNSKNVAGQAEKKSKRKFGYKEEQEYIKMESQIHALETEVAALTAAVQDPKIVSDSKRLLEATQTLALKSEELDRMFERWAELEALKAEN